MTFSIKGIALCMAAGVLPALFGGGSAAAQSIDMRREYYEGRWDWKGVLKATQNASNVSRIQFNTADRAIYCYDRKCWNVKLDKTPDGGFNFSTGGKNYFEFNPGRNPVQLPARFWVNMSPPARSPDATIAFSRKP